MPSILPSSLLLLLLAAPAAAQVVRGTVVEETSGKAVPGSFVVLLDSAGAQTGAALTGPAGDFEISVRVPGEYRLGVDRIGYLTVLTPFFPVPAGRTIEYRLAVRVEPVELAGIDVSVESGCRVRPGAEFPAARLWEEARKALNATAWVQRKGLLRYEVRSVERRLDPWTQRVEEEHVETRRGLSRGSPYVALDVDQLSEAGFARLDGEAHVYYAPDATTLLSDWFLDNHCFHVVPASGGEPGLVGLAFEPAGEREQIDVQGTLWLDERTAELSRLDFGYTGLPTSIRHAEAGGRVEFDRLPSGEWIVPRWRIRMPVVRGAEPDLYSHLTMDPHRRGPVLLAYEEDSGEVVKVVAVRSEERRTRTARRIPSEPIPFMAPPVAAATPRELPAVIPAEPIAVVVDKEEEEARSRGESRYVVTAADISAVPLPLGQILERHIPGLRHVVHGSCSVLQTRNGLVQLVVLDGQRIYDTCVLSLVQAEDVERIEFLPSLAASIEYGDATGGGVLIVTTRHAR